MRVSAESLVEKICVLPSKEFKDVGNVNHRAFIAETNIVYLHVTLPTVNLKMLSFFPGYWIL